MVRKTKPKSRAYLAGPMRNYEEYNFPAFDEATAWLRGKGWIVISPAEIDRELGLDPTHPLPDWFTLETAMQRDLHEITHPETEAIILLPGWVESEGSLKEVTTAMACGRQVYFYEPEGVFEDGAMNPDKRLVAVSGAIVEFVIAEAQKVKAEINAEMFVSETGGKKGQKLLRPDLIPAEAIKEVALCYGIGAQNPAYGENNWLLGYPYSKSLAALERHLLEWKLGNEDDDEGFKHLAAVVFHACTLIYRDKFQPEFDDVHR